MFELFALMVAGHALADYPLQGEFLSRAKHRVRAVPGIPWYLALFVHSAIHAGFVGVITGSVWLALSELLSHALTDYAKCNRRISFLTDQSIHVGCKLLWALIAVSAY